MELTNTRKLMERKRADSCFDSYAVLVYKDGEKKCLFSDHVNEYTYFDIASMGKVFITSTLILQSIDQGILKLNDTLDMFFDVDDPCKKNITIKQLLTHTSGIIRYPLTKNYAKDGSVAIAEEILSFPLAYKPGENYIYSCNGYILLGFILEKIHGIPLEEIYNKNLAKPLGLRRTAFEIKLDEENAAVCYRWKSGYSKRFDDENVLAMEKTGGSGGQQSCLHDIERFIMAVLEKNNVLYSEKWFDIAEQNHTPNFSEGRGLGYLVVDENYPQTGKLFSIGSFGHCGHTGQSFFIDRKENLFVIILTNATRFLNMKSNFTGYDYNEICRMRKEIHNEILTDFT